MHHEVSVRQARVNFLDALNGKNVAGGFAGELVGAVARADCDRKGIKLRFADKFGGLIRVGEKLIARHRGVGAVAVFLVALHGFQGAEAAEFAFNGNADAVGVFHHTLGDGEVVVIGGDRFAVAHQ